MADAREFKKPSPDNIRKMLTPEQFHVTRENGTEKPFVNRYWDNKEAGIYVDIVTGEPLFSSLDKYDSGTGWPSFSKPLDKAAVVERSDNSHSMTRTEVRSKFGDNHLGHVFNEGSSSPSGFRYCLNSAALRFIPVGEMEKEGYGEYLKRFKASPAP